MSGCVFYLEFGMCICEKFQSKRFQNSSKQPQKELNIAKTPNMVDDLDSNTKKSTNNTSHDSHKTFEITCI